MAQPSTSVMLGLPVRTITSRHNPVVAQFRAAERCRRTARRHVLLDGVRLITDAYRAGVPLEMAVFSIGSLRRQDATLQRLVRHLESSGVEVIAASASAIEAMSPVRSMTSSHTPASFSRQWVCRTQVTWVRSFAPRKPVEHPVYW